MRLRASPAKGTSSVSGWGTKILQAAQCHKKNPVNFMFCELHLSLKTDGCWQSLVFPGLRIHHTHLCLHPHMAFLKRHQSLDSGPLQLQTISRSLTQSYLQGSFFRRSQSHVPGVRTWTYVFGHHSAYSTRAVMRLTACVCANPLIPQTCGLPHSSQETTGKGITSQPQSAHPQHGAVRASLAGWRGQDGSRREAPREGTPGVHSTCTQTPSSVPKDRTPHSPLGHPRPHWDPDAPKHLSARTGHVGVPLRELVDLLGGGSAMD